MITIVDLLKKYNLLLQEMGSRYRICCPFHDDSNPSLVVYPETNSWYCFTCGFGGSPVKFMMYFEKLSYDDACNKLGMNNFDIDVEEIMKQQPKVEKDLNEELNFMVSSKVQDFLQKDPKNWGKIVSFLKQFDKRLVIEKLNEEQAKKILDETQKLFLS
jgi:DNA primase